MDEELVYQWSPYSATLKCCQSNEIKCHNIKLLCKCGIQGVLGADVAFDPRVKMIISFFSVNPICSFLPRSSQLWVGNRSLRSNQMNQLLSWSFNQVYHRFYLWMQALGVILSIIFVFSHIHIKFQYVNLYLLCYSLLKGYIKQKKYVFYYTFRFLSFGWNSPLCSSRPTKLKLSFM